MYRFVVIIVISLFSFQVNAITLEKALVNAYNNNEELKIIRQEFLTAIEQFPQALSQFMPSVSASFDSTSSRQKAKSQYARGALSSETKAFQKGIKLEQPIFNGGGSVAALKAAQSGFRAARAQYYSKEQDIFLKAIEVYITCHEAQERYDIAETSVRSNQKQLEATQEQLNVGEATQVELASARAALSLAETKKLSAYASLQTAKANFTRIFGIDPLNVTLPAVSKDLPSALEDFVAKSLKVNQDIEATRHFIASSKANETIAKAGLLPQVSFSVRSGRTYYDPETPGSSLNNMGVSSTLSVVVPIIPNGGAVYSKIRQAKLVTRNNAVKLDAIIKEVNTKCIGSWEGHNMAKSSIISATEGVDAAQIAYDGIVQEELVGTKTILDVLASEERLNNAKIAKVEATKQYILTAHQIKALLGRLTAKSLNLKVNYFDPEQEFKKVKMKIIGF